MSRIENLERIITHLDTLYEVGENCVHPDTLTLVSDGEYDILRRELTSLNSSSKLFETPTASKVDSGAKKIKHDPPLTSISKAGHEHKPTQEKMLFKWLDDCTKSSPDKVRNGKFFNLGAKKIEDSQQEERTYNGEVVTYPRGYFYQTYKLDGVALALYYEKGQLVKAGLRPRDGVNGEDVTKQVKFVTGIPQTLNELITCSIRGELICTLSDFDKVQKRLANNAEKLRANPRNHAAGGIRQFKQPEKTREMLLSFIAYAIEGLDNPPYKTEIERAKWCNKTLGIPFVKTQEFNFYQLQVLEEDISKLDYEVDGVVVGVNSIEDQEQLGRHGDPKTGNPKGKIAWKFTEERKKATVKEIEWKTGRTGAVKPVAIFDPIRLAGTDVRRATLHNLGFMRRNKIDVGTTIVVLKAGKIIPKVVAVDSGQCSGEPSYPNTCPSCNKTTKIDHTPASGSREEMFELVCTNNDCSSQNVGGLCHYLTTFGVVGLGESRVAALVEGGVVKVPSDFYKVDLDGAMGCELSKRQSLLAIASIHMVRNPEQEKDDDKLDVKIERAKKNKKQIPLWKLFASFGIESAGKSAGKALVQHFGNFDDIRAADVTQLESVPDVGTKTAEIVCEYLSENSGEIDELLKFIEPQLPKTGPLTGQTFVFTGGFSGGKKKWESAVEKLGGKCSSSVSKNTNYVVEGVDAGSKVEKAKKLNISLISLDGLKKIL